MFQIKESKIRSLLFQGNFGLEKEMLRITEDGHLSHSQHPFPVSDTNITRDFCENQTEINTPIFKSADEVVENLYYHTQRIKETLDTLSPRELIWSFSNPPYIMSEEDIPIAQFVGTDAKKTEYRNYLANRYGRYKMTYSGIHFNYSFSGDLLRSNYEAETGKAMAKGEETSEYQEYIDRLYLDLAERLVEYGWIMVALTAASPIMDNSFYELGRTGGSVFTGMGSPRCSEIGYWNAFAPILQYSDIRAYTSSIQQYVDKGLIKAPSELYYPIRLKPKKEYSMDSLRTRGVNHIELRMLDLNPFCKEGIDIRDVKFAQMLLIWLSTKPTRHLTAEEQVQAVQNYKNAAHYNLHTAHIQLTDGSSPNVADATLDILNEMEEFYDSFEEETKDIINYQKLKITDSHNYRYSHIIRREFSGDFVKKGLQLCANYSASTATKE